MIRTNNKNIQIIDLEYLPNKDVDEYYDIYGGDSSQVPKRLLKKWASKANRLQNIEKNKGIEAYMYEFHKYQNKKRLRTWSFNSELSTESNKSDSSYVRNGISYADILKSNI